MKRRFITCDDFTIGFNSDSYKSSVLVLKSTEVTDEFYTETCIANDVGSKCTAYVDPVRLLFAQERINSLGAGALEAWLDSLKNTSFDPLSEIRKKCTDNELKELIKCRHIQQPSEVFAWAQYCKENFDNFNNELKKLQQNTDVISNESNVEPNS